MKSLRALFCLLACWLSAGTARASMAYPTELARELGLGREPSCQLCHHDDVGGLGTVVTPFGLHLMVLGALPDDPESLRAALALAEQESADSDGDGASDIAELKGDGDPNLAASELPEDPRAGLPKPQTGCSIGAGRRPGHLELALALLPVLLLWRRARRRFCAAVT